jgi:hypothetical protein
MTAKADTSQLQGAPEAGLLAGHHRLPEVVLEAFVAC